ncbi:MAG TPA: DUF262 domain-containing HNH endonuclease family protein [Ktedonobacterales bacterium]|nr:DUF262 domain-containing HNH endonuclease family protein [Ktedonobacterales bacterium]
MAIEIKGEQYSVNGVFSDEFEFVVPPYQRPYLWETEHAGDLLDDLLDFMGDSDAAVSDLNPYFLGSIVLIKKNTPDAQIVDGQQRLITLTILLSVLRALVPLEYSDSISKRIYDTKDPVAGLDARFRLHPKRQDASFFEQHIQRADGIDSLRPLNLAKLTDSKRHMAENALYLYDQLKDTSEELRIRLAQFIIQRCLLVVVSTPDLDSAYRIFSVLNDRGLDLAYTDILKADIIGRLPDALQQMYTEKWDEIEEDLGRSDFEALQSHILTLYRGQHAKKSILEDFRTYVVQPVNNPATLIDSVLILYANMYAAIRDEQFPQAAGGNSIDTYLHWLNRIPDTYWTPVAMDYLTRYYQEPQRLRAFFRDLERLAVGQMLLHATANKRTERYAQIHDAIKSGMNLGDASSPMQLTSNERRYMLNALSGDVYKQYGRTRQYVLLRLDSLLSTGEAVYNYPVISVEHVLPQNPVAGSEWVGWFPTAELREEWVHKLGNLVLLSKRKNAQAGNMTFNKKKTTYFTRDGVSPFALTTQVLRERVWTPQVVERRQKELVQKLKELWRL